MCCSAAPLHLAFVSCAAGLCSRTLPIAALGLRNGSVQSLDRDARIGQSAQLFDQICSNRLMVSYPCDLPFTDFDRILHPDSNWHWRLDCDLLRLGKMESLEYRARSLRPFLPGI